MITTGDSLLSTMAATWPTAPTSLGPKRTPHATNWAVTCWPWISTRRRLPCTIGSKVRKRTSGPELAGKMIDQQLFSRVRFGPLLDRRQKGRSAVSMDLEWTTDRGENFEATQRFLFGQRWRLSIPPPEIHR